MYQLSQRRQGLGKIALRGAEGSFQMESKEEGVLMK